MHSPICQNVRLSLLFQYLQDHEGTAQSLKRECTALRHSTWVQHMSVQHVGGVLSVPNGVQGTETVADEVRSCAMRYKACRSGLET